MLDRLMHIVELWLTRRVFEYVTDDAAMLTAIEQRAYRINDGDARKARRFAEHVAKLRTECLLRAERDRLQAELKAARIGQAKVKP